MPNLIYSMNVSLDGFIEDTHHSLDWGIIDRELHQYFNDQQAGIGAFLYGRGMYENMSAYWPTADKDPAATDFTLEWARLWKAMPKVVFSTTLKKVAWNSRLVKENAVEEVKKLKAQPGKDLSVSGAGVATAFIRLGLVDEFQLFIHPVVLGGGKPFFPAMDQPLHLRLVETHPFASGVVLLRYKKENGTTDSHRLEFRDNPEK